MHLLPYLFDGGTTASSTSADISSQMGFAAWKTALQGYSLANKIASYVLGILIAIFIIVGIILVVKHVIDRRSDKKMLVSGIIIIVVGAIVCAVLLGVLTGSVFPNAVKQLFQDGVNSKWIAVSNSKVTAGQSGSIPEINSSLDTLTNIAKQFKIGTITLAKA